MKDNYIESKVKELETKFMEVYGLTKSQASKLAERQLFMEFRDRLVKSN